MHIRSHFLLDRGVGEGPSGSTAASFSGSGDAGLTQSGGLTRWASLVGAVSREGESRQGWREAGKQLRMGQKGRCMTAVFSLCFPLSRYLALQPPGTPRAFWLGASETGASPCQGLQPGACT